VERLPLALYSPPLPALVSAVLLPLLLLPSVLLPPVRVHPLAALLGMRAMPSCFRLALLLGSSLTWTIVAALPALAQTPMSPIFPTLSSKSAQAPAPKPAAVAPIASAPMPAPAVARPERDDPAVATAAIPPPLPAAPVTKTEPEKPSATTAEPESKAEAQPTVKRQKRAARRRHYTRRYLPFYTSSAYATATLSGWGYGRFGPAPNASTGQ
jgi:outer membrane biosynthesis protein TonB